MPLTKDDVLALRRTSTRAFAVLRRPPDGPVRVELERAQGETLQDFKARFIAACKAALLPDTTDEERELFAQECNS